MKIEVLGTDKTADADVVLPTTLELPPTSRCPEKREFDLNVIRVKDPEGKMDTLVLWADKRLVEPLRPLLDCEPYWGDAPKFEDDGHLGWILTGIVPDEQPDTKALVDWIKSFWIRQAQRCISWLTRGIKREAT